MTTIIELPKTVEEYKSALKKGIEAYQQSPVKKENKLNECVAKSLNFKNQDSFSAALKKTQELASLSNVKYSAIIDDDNIVYINDLEIHEDVEQEEMSAYRVRTPEELVDNIFMYIRELEGVRYERTKETLRLLMSLKDEYIFESIYDDEIVAFSQRPERFNEIAEEMIEYHYDVVKKKEADKHGVLDEDGEFICSKCSNTFNQDDAVEVGNKLFCADCA